MEDGAAGWVGKGLWGVLWLDDCEQANRVRDEPLKKTAREAAGPG